MDLLPDNDTNFQQVSVDDLGGLDRTSCIDCVWYSLCGDATSFRTSHHLDSAGWLMRLSSMDDCTLLYFCSQCIYSGWRKIKVSYLLFPVSLVSPALKRIRFWRRVLAATTGSPLAQNAACTDAACTGTACTDAACTDAAYA